MASSLESFAHAPPFNVYEYIDEVLNRLVPIEEIEMNFKWADLPATHRHLQNIYKLTFRRIEALRRHMSRTYSYSCNAAMCDVIGRARRRLLDIASPYMNDDDIRELSADEQRCDELNVLELRRAVTIHNQPTAQLATSRLFLFTIVVSLALRLGILAKGYCHRGYIGFTFTHNRVQVRALLADIMRKWPLCDSNETTF